MAHITSGIFRNSKHAGMAVSELKEAGFTDDISVIAKEWDDTTVDTHTVKEDSRAEGAAVGAVVGGLAGLLAATGALLVPGLGTVLIAGPFAALIGAAGAMTGGLIGFLTGQGISEEDARMYEEAVGRGEVLVIVTGHQEDKANIRSVLEKHGASVDTPATRRYANA